MIPSPDQEQAIGAFRQWMAEGSPHGIFKLNGYAGTGKTSVAIKLINEVGQDQAILCAPTGKAAYRLRQKTGLATMSCHQLLRHPVEEDDYGKPTFVEKMWREGQRPKLIVVDEASMVNANLSRSLLTFVTSDNPDEKPVPILALGDPFQLPPVTARGEESWCLLDTRKAGPTYTLTQIHRQAEGSGVLDLAHAVRNSQLSRLETVGDGQTARVGDQNIGEFLQNGKTANYIHKGVKFVARFRKTVALINETARRQLERFEPGFQVGDTVMTLNNNYDLDVQNGSEFVVVEKRPNGIPDRFEVALRSVDDGMMRYLPDAIYEDVLNPLTRLERGVVKITTSYAVTCHKYQGSEADKVFVINEHGYRDEEMDRRRWLYTAITRARKQVFVLGSRV